MGFDNEYARDPIIVDLETVAHPCAAEFIEAPDLDGITAAKNLVDPIKVRDDIAKRRAAAEADHARNVSRAALDWNLSCIVAIGSSVDGGTTVDAGICRDEQDEGEALRAFWARSSGRLLLGFFARKFDVPTLIQRSRLLGIPHRDISLARFGKGNVIDLHDILTFDDVRYESIMPRSLKVFSRRFGIPVHDEIDGKDIAQLVATGAWDAVLAHVTSDVRLTAALAQRIGVWTAHVEVAG